MKFCCSECSAKAGLLKSAAVGWKAYSIISLLPVKHFALVYMAPKGLLNWLLQLLYCCVIIPYQHARPCLRTNPRPRLDLDLSVPRAPYVLSMHCVASPAIAKLIHARTALRTVLGVSGACCNFRMKQSLRSSCWSLADWECNKMYSHQACWAEGKPSRIWRCGGT